MVKFVKAITQGLKGYFRDLGFGQNTVRDSGKRKISRRETGLNKIWALDAGFFCLSIWNSGNCTKLELL